MKLVTTPTYEWLSESLAACRSRFLVASPYVGSILPQLINRLTLGVATTLLTRTDLRDFAAGASDIAAVCATCKAGASILSTGRLHAKVYVIDGNRALITSANATHGGMFRNLEFGVVLDDETHVEIVATTLLSGFGAAQTPQEWKLDDLERLREPVSMLRERIPAVRLFSPQDEQRPSLQIDPEVHASLIAGLPKWGQLTLRGVLSLPEDEFSIDDFYRICLPAALKQFPRNRFPREKLRQQLQRLRDLGIVDFLGAGRYRRLITVPDV